VSGFVIEKKISDGITLSITAVWRQSMSTETVAAQEEQ